MSSSSNRRARRAARRTSQVAMVAAIAIGAQAGAAAAATCAASSYGGQVTPDFSWAGVERYIDSAAVTRNSDQWIGRWIGVNDQSNACPYGTLTQICWMQAGVAVGDVAFDHGHPVSADTVYWEANSTVAGYIGSYVTGLNADHNDFFTVFYTGQSVLGKPKFQAVVNDGTGNRTLATTGLDTGTSEQVQANLEVHSGTAEACPGIGYQLFGTNGTNNYSSSWSLFKSANGTTWEEWLNMAASDDTGNAQHQEIHNWSAFKAF